MPGGRQGRQHFEPLGFRGEDLDLGGQVNPRLRHLSEIQGPVVHGARVRVHERLRGKGGCGRELHAVCNDRQRRNRLLARKLPKELKLGKLRRDRSGIRTWPGNIAGKAAANGLSGPPQGFQHPSLTFDLLSDAPIIGGAERKRKGTAERHVLQIANSLALLYVKGYTPTDGGRAAAGPTKVEVGKLSDCNRNQTLPPHARAPRTRFKRLRVWYRARPGVRRRSAFTPLAEKSAEKGSKRAGSCHEDPGQRIPKCWDREARGFGAWSLCSLSTCLRHAFSFLCRRGGRVFALGGGTSGPAESSPSSRFGGPEKRWASLERFSMNSASSFNLPKAISAHRGSRILEYTGSVTETWKFARGWT